MSVSSHVSHIVLKFDPAEYPFHHVISRLIDAGELSELEMEKGRIKPDWSFYKNMEQSKIFQKLYRRLNSTEGDEFYELYEHFIQNEIRPLFSGSIYYQSKPSHRIFFKNIDGRLQFHRDQDYGHLPEEINFLLPQTEAFDSNTLWIEQEEGAGDYEPVPLELGEYVRFRGSVLKHGAMKNKTGKTRVSFDFRVLREKDATAAFKRAQQLTVKDSGNPVMDNAQKFSFCA